MTNNIKLATRKSPLALMQANMVKDFLIQNGVFNEIELISMSTSGDTLDNETFKKEGGKGLFLKELESALLKGQADIAVHSMKDVPATLDARFNVSSIMKREDPRDVFISHKHKALSDIETGVIGSSSPRRQAILKHINAGIKSIEIRGNIQTRLEKLKREKLDGIILAKSGLKRMGLDAIITESLDVDDFAGRLSFFFAVGMNFFMEASKLRAARIIWSRIMKEFSPKKEASSVLRTHCQTSGVSLQEQDPYNNVIRTAYEAMSAVLGGTQSLHTNALDEAMGLPTEFSARIARNTQIILQEETGIAKVVDPLAGSYYVESLTNELIEKSWDLIQEVEELGGMTKAVESGMPKLKIETSAANKQAAIDKGEEVIVGVNKYKPDHDDEVEILDVDNEQVRESQITRLKKIRDLRNEKTCSDALANLRLVAESRIGNLLEAAITAARARATVGEISAVMEGVFGRYRAEVRTLSGVYGAAYEGDEGFESIKDKMEQFAEQEGRRPRMLVVKMGQDGHDRGAKVIATAFADMGFDVDVGPLFQTPEEAAKDAVDNDVHVVGISSQAAGHKTLAPLLIEELNKLGVANEIIVICGGVIPSKDYDFLYKKGVKAIFGPGTNIPDAAKSIIGLIKDARNV